MLITKLVLYVVLAALIGVITSLTRKARAGNLQVMPKAVLMGRLAMLIGITIVILAVSIFR